jgi:hypothetical protein
METTLPAIQAEQVEDDVAPVTAEYVPAKARDEEYVLDDSKTNRFGEVTKGEGEKVRGKNACDSGRWVSMWGGRDSLLSGSIMRCDMQDKSTRMCKKSKRLP